MISLPAFLCFQEDLERRAAVQLAQIEAAVEFHRQCHGSLPAKLSDLDTPVPEDPWGREYRYENGNVWSLGADGKASDDDVVLSVWRIRRTEKKLADLAAAIEEFRPERNRPPFELSELPNPDVLDAWGRPFSYQVPGSSGRAYNLWSRGSDVKEESDDVWHGGKPKKPAKPKIDAWASWAECEIGAEVEFEMETAGMKLTIVKTLSEKGDDRHTLTTIISMVVGGSESKTPGEEPVPMMKGGADGICPLCSRNLSEHEHGSKWSVENVKVGDRVLECHVMDSPAKNCRGDRIPKFRIWYSDEVPGQLVALEMEEVKTKLIRFKK